MRGILQVAGARKFGPAGPSRPDLSADGLIALETPAGDIVHGMAYGRAVGADLVVSVRTVHLKLSPEKPAATRNVWLARAERMVFQGDFTQVHVAWGEHRLVIRSAATLPLAPAQEAFMSVEPSRVVLLEA